MNKKSLCILTLAPLFLIGCANGTEEGNTSSDAGETPTSSQEGQFVSSVNSVGSKGDDSNDSISTKPSNYDKLTESYFNELKTSGLLITGTVNWEFSGELTDSYYGTTYDGSESVKVEKFVGLSSSTLASEVTYAVTTEKANYSFRVFKNAQGKLVRLYLGADNKVHEVPYVMTDTDEDGDEVTINVPYDYYFGNPFNFIEYSDITANKDGTYSVNAYEAEEFGIATLFFGETFEAEMSSVTLSLKDDILHMDIKTKREAYESDSSVYNWFTGSFDVTLANKDDLDKPTPYAEVEENAPLKTAFAELEAALSEGGRGFTMSYTENYNDTEYARDVAKVNTEGFVNKPSASGSVPNGIAKYDNGTYYYFEVRNGKVTKNGSSDSLLLPDYSENSLSAYVFQKDDENTYSARTRNLAQYAAYTMFDRDHAQNIYGYYSYLQEGFIQGTSDLVIHLKDGHIDTIDYNYVMYGKTINGTCVFSNINDTELGYPFKTKQLGPVQAGYEHFMGDFYSYDYGTVGREKSLPQWALRVYGDGKYSILEKEQGYSQTLSDDAEKKQGVLNGDTFTITTPDGYEVALKYYEAGNEFELGYTDKNGNPTKTPRYMAVLYGYSENKEHIFTFALDPYSEWNEDSGLLESSSSSEAA